MTAAGFVPVAEMCLLKLVALTVFILAAFSLSVSTALRYNHQINIKIVNSGTLCYQAQTPCPTYGWFGPNCQYQCHCAGSAPCDKHDYGWVLPSLETSTDNKDTACSRENLGSVTVTLHTPIPLTWLRVVVSDAESPVTSVTLSGRGVNFLSSLYISAGKTQTSLVPNGWLYILNLNFSAGSPFLLPLCNPSNSLFAMLFWPYVN
ncbi:hypothetical protein RRG08_059706 [Elysia crispata]|uniref:Uncharacterized protein n=1 Tax=Elysia crispata TaxID=231223 RepID=A0AAE0ZX82_9GAST|nr:hypothetical protein RRG08_059706 [Elysia crispata]